MNLQTIGPILALGFPMGVEWIVIAALVALVIIAVLRSTSARPPGAPPSAFPVMPPVPLGPGRFRVSGVNRQTKADVVWECSADSPENARVKGELEGIVVTRVDRV
jgi:hypothetical protein